MADRAGSPSDDRGSEPVLDWLDEIAAAEGLSREAAIEYLISSYWRLEEIVDLLEAGDGSIEATADPEPARDDVEGLHERFDTLLSDLRRREAATEDHEELLSSILELGDRLERLEATLRGRDDPGETLEQLGSRVDDLEAGAVDVERFESFADRTASFQQELSGQHESLRSRVRTEFDHIRTVLVHLLEEPAADGEAVRAVRRELAELRADREALDTLTRSANRQGTREADCAHCGETVDLALLRSSTCPVCESRFTDLETVPGFLGLFDTHRLQVEPGSAD